MKRWPGLAAIEVHQTRVSTSQMNKGLHCSNRQNCGTVQDGHCCAVHSIVSIYDLHAGQLMHMLLYHEPALWGE